MVNYFRYKIRKGLSGIHKISEQSDIKRLKSLEIEGLQRVLDDNEFIYFSVEGQLYRRLKLIKLGNITQDEKIKFLDFMVSRSQKITEANIPNEFTMWSSGDYWYYDNANLHEEVKQIKQEDRNRRNYHNNMYKQRLKR